MIRRWSTLEPSCGGGREDGDPLLGFLALVFFLSYSSHAWQIIRTLAWESSKLNSLWCYSMVCTLYSAVSSYLRDIFRSRDYLYGIGSQNSIIGCPGRFRGPQREWLVWRYRGAKGHESKKIQVATLELPGSGCIQPNNDSSSPTWYGVTWLDLACNMCLSFGQPWFKAWWRI